MPSRKDLANAIRALSMDAVQQANSGHPGMPMGMADIAEVLWKDFLQHNPADPNWFNRDRFVLSNGHGSMLLYSLLHLTGYDLSLDDIKNFRQLNSKTPGHPEYGYAPGIETTTGPLGQGLANAVGMALAEKILSAQFNQELHKIVDHYTYVFVGDGCLMEGISHEVSSLAGTFELGKLVVFYDDNGISIDGKVGGWFNDDTPKRFEAYGWQVIDKVDGHDAEAVRQAIVAAQEDSSRPTLICCKTEIGFGAPNLAGSNKAHGSPLGADEIAATRKNIGWPHPAFVIPDDIKQAWDERTNGQEKQRAWDKQFADYAKQFPELAAEFTRRMKGDLPQNWPAVIETYIKECQQNGKDIATRQGSGNAIEAIGKTLPELLGGSADLTGSNNTWWSGSEPIRAKQADGNYINYGVREFGMFAMMNGLALHGGFIPYAGTFLVFSDYGRNAIRLAAMMKQKVLFVLSHDSIGLGEDGPTHQPIEHAAMLRLTPELTVWRPADDVESAVMWEQAVEHQGASCLLLTRQKVPHQQRSAEQLANIKRGGYILRDTAAKPDVILIATGSEVGLAMSAADVLAKQDVQARVVSMPATNVFDQQDAAYREAVLPSDVTMRIAIEAAAKDFWYKYVGIDGRVIGMSTFGESAPAEDLYKAFAISVDNIVQTALELNEAIVA